MRQRIAVLLCGALCVFACLVAKTNASVIAPIGLAPGSEYQLIFASADKTVATSTSISTYNTFVTTEATSLNALYPSATWTAVASTSTVNAVTNAPNVQVAGSFLPIYNTQGILVSDQASGGLYGGTLLHAVNYTQTGASAGLLAAVWTGSLDSGLADGALVLGAASARYGLSDGAGAGWASDANAADTTSHLMYALSSVLTTPSVAPPVLTVTGGAPSGSPFDDDNNHQMSVTVDPNVKVTSTDTDITGATVAITSGLHAGGDFLSIGSPVLSELAGGAVPPQSGTTDGISWSYSSLTGVMTLTGSATPANYQTVLDEVTFQTVSGVGTRDISFSASDSSASPTTNGAVSGDYVVVAPEPASVVMMFLGATGLFLAARRRRCPASRRHS